MRIRTEESIAGSEQRAASSEQALIATRHSLLAQRQLERDRRSPAGGAVDGQLAADAGGALAHGVEAEAGEIALAFPAGIEADAVVGDGRDHPPVAAVGADGRLRGAGVLTHGPAPLLTDAAELRPVPGAEGQAP